MKFFFKNYIFSLVQPTAFIGILFVIGLFFLFKNKIKVSKILLSFSLFLFLIFSLDPLTEYFLSKTEKSYHAFRVDSLSAPKLSQIQYVVVLAGGFDPGGELPLSSELPPSTLIRLVEGIAIRNKIPQAKLVLTGKGYADKTEAQAMGEMAQSLGVNHTNIILENESTNTFEHTKNLAALLGDKPFILVTSALHMQRAMKLFLKARLNPIAAPTNHLLRGDYSFFRIGTLLPNSENLRAIDKWSYEFFGIIWEKLTGKI